MYFRLKNIILEIYQAYDICKSRALLREQVYILGRMGNHKQALAVIINELGDIKEVIIVWVLSPFLGCAFLKVHLNEKFLMSCAGYRVCEHATK